MEKNSLTPKKFIFEARFSETKIYMSLRIITKYRAADLEIRFRTKSILKPYGYATAHTASVGDK